MVFFQGFKNRAESRGCFQRIRQQNEFDSNISKRLFFFSLFFIPSTGTYILLAIPGAPLTQEAAVFLGFALAPNQTVPSSTLGQKRSASGLRAVVTQERDLAYGERVSSDASLRCSKQPPSEKSEESAGAGWGERGRSLSLTDGTGTSAALLSPHQPQSRVFCCCCCCCCCCPEGLSLLPYPDCSLKCDKTPHGKL